MTPHHVSQWIWEMSKLPFSISLITLHLMAIKKLFFSFFCVFLYDAMYYTVRRHDVQIVLLYFLDYITAKYYSVTMCCILSVFEEY